MPAHKVIPEPRTCPICKTVFEVGGRTRKPRDQLYCSLRCLALSRIRQPAIAELSRIDAAYIAGIFDGEGSVILWDRGFGGRRQLRCSIANTYAPLMDWLKETIGTGSIIRHVHPPEKGYKDSLTWQCYGQNAVALLKQMMPYLIIKKDAAIAAIASQAVKWGR